jgi:hypothetical protein
MADVDRDCLESLTFITVYKKLGISISAIPNSKVVSTIIEKHGMVARRILMM